MDIQPKKVSVWLSEQTITEKINDTYSLIVNKQRTDGALAPFSQDDSRTVDTVIKIASDDYLRTFFFLQSKLDFEVSKTYPVSQSYPFLLTQDYDLFKSLTVDYKEDIEKVKENNTDYKKEFEEINDTILFDALSMVFTDRRVIRAVRSHKPDSLKSAVDSAFEDHKDEFMKRTADYIEAISVHLDDMSSTSEIVDWLANFEIAQKNTRVLHEAKFLDNVKSFFASFNRLSDTNLRISTETICFDCIFNRKDSIFYKSEITNSRDVSLESKCPRCKGNGLMHKLVVTYPVGIHNLILPQSNWLPETIIGYALSSLPEVEKVYVHKKIHTALKGQGQTPGVESDVTLITKDKKIILLEVSTTQELDQLHENAHRKINFLKQNQVIYDKFGFITADNTYGEYTWLYEKNGVIFKAKHIRNIADFVRNTLILEK